MRDWTHLGNEQTRGLLTPALLLDRGAFDRNLQKMQGNATRHGVSLRPHFKTHKCPTIAHLQIRAGAIGVSCATVREVVAATGAGIDNVLLTSPVPSYAKLAPLLDLTRSGMQIIMVADSVESIQMLAAAADNADVTVPLLLDVDGGDSRTGVQSLDEAALILAEIHRHDSLDLRGIQVYAGRAQHTVGGSVAKKTYLSTALGLARQVRALVTTFKPSAQMVSGGGTGTAHLDMLGGFFTEVQAGSYVVMDDQYFISDKWDGVPPFEQALFIMATVISRRSQDVWTIDAGTKSFACDAGPPRIVTAAYLAQATCTLRGDEYGQLNFRSDEGAQRPTVGDRLLMSVPHCDPTFCLYPQVHHLDERGQIVSWEIKR